MRECKELASKSLILKSPSHPTDMILNQKSKMEAGRRLHEISFFRATGNLHQEVEKKEEV